MVSSHRRLVLLDESGPETHVVLLVNHAKLDKRWANFMRSLLDGLTPIIIPNGVTRGSRSCWLCIEGRGAPLDIVVAGTSSELAPETLRIMLGSDN